MARGERLTELERLLAARVGFVDSGRGAFLQAHGDCSPRGGEQEAGGLEETASIYHVARAEVSETPEGNEMEHVAVELAMVPASAVQLDVTEFPDSGRRVSLMMVPRGMFAAASATVAGDVALIERSGNANAPPGEAGAATPLTETIVTVDRGAAGGKPRRVEIATPTWVPEKVLLEVLRRMRPWPPEGNVARRPPSTSNVPAPPIAGAMRWMAPPEPPPA